MGLRVAGDGRDDAVGLPVGPNDGDRVGRAVAVAGDAVGAVVGDASRAPGSLPHVPSMHSDGRSDAATPSQAPAPALQQRLNPSESSFSSSANADRQAASALQASFRHEARPPS